MEDFNIVEIAKRTAENLSQLVVKMAERVAELEAENAELKRKIGANIDDLK